MTTASAETVPTSAVPPPPKCPARWCYVDIGAFRIQTWIDRTPRLRFRRGASNLLYDLTSRFTVESYLPQGVLWNTEAGERSGVVTLKIDGSEAEAARRRALDVAVLVAQHMRRAAPALELVAFLGIAGTYAAADMDPAKRLANGEVLLDLPALPADAVVAKPCDECRSSAAERSPITVAQESKSLCRDCLSRLESAGASSAADDERRPVSQSQLELDLRGLLGAGVSSITTPIDFAALAAMVEHRQAFDASTQIATITADGNRIGDFMAGLRGKLDEQEMTTAIAQAARTVVAAGAAELLRRDPQLTDRAGGVSLPVIAHYVGGDDIVVSVPAEDGWAFVTTMCGRFAEAIKAELTTTRAAVTLPTLSAGMVFHHRSQPLPDVLAKAHGHLTLAKQATRGAGASVSFLDLTADGDRAVGDRAWTIAELNKRAAQLDRLSTIPAAQRTQLLTLLRECEDAAYRSDEVEPPEEALRRRLRTMRIPVLMEIAPDGDSGRQSRAALRRALDVARWWRPVRGEETA